jgi:small multidrug resistance pump
VAAVAYAAGANFMKASNGLSVPIYAALVYGSFAFGATLQAIAIQYQHVGVSNTIVLGVEAIGAFLMSVAFFREPVTIVKLVAISLVAVGVYLLRGA